jgi:cystathionine beta-lyase/cystathionine gamma-synthase
MRHQNESTLRIARYLESHPSVERVHYTGLESHPGHERASRILDGHGGVLSFEPRGGAGAAKSFVERMKIAAHAPSLGGVETLVTRPAVSTHGSLTAEERARSGVRDELIRLAIGLENTDDLIEDFDQALA